MILNDCATPREMYFLLSDSLWDPGRAGRIACAAGVRLGLAVESRPMSGWKIIQASNGGEVAAARELFQEYADSLDIDLCFQGFKEELATLPGTYAPPNGRLLLACGRGAYPPYLGCVALRSCASLHAYACEMKRLYVRPQARGAGVGRALATAVIDAARDIGYKRMVLDTLGTMDAALGLYRSLGFRETAAYYNNPISNAVYLALQL